MRLFAASRACMKVRTWTLACSRPRLGFAGTLAVTLVSALVCSSTAQAQAAPPRTLRIVVPYGASGAPDVIARVLAQKLAPALGQSVIVDNRPGAGGIVAAELVAKAAPDGATFFLADLGHVAINPNLYPKLPYDPLRDFVPVTLVAQTPLFMATVPSIGSVHQLIELSHQKKGLHYGSSGNGSPHHLGMELFRMLTGAQLIHIPYKGVAQSVPALLAGDVDVIIVGLPSIAPHAKSGRARLLGVTTIRRTPLMPDLPTVAEQGAAGFDINVGVGLLAPAGTPREVIDRLQVEVVKLLAVPETAQYLTALGIDPVGSTPEQYGEMIRADLRKFADLVRNAAVKVD